ncbi:unnamed protein product [Effrenium voratum]|uniref:Uncharacterized protein n=1 Tax=Effrenium voratum TaxID=2562239 RepID=A0AA36HUZ6_9DINO|nr:unnamed protein product [Effrenium voratum]CAJ1416489.1 unnamed protein product [Effrenium voratum]CAJ1456920.1 unnamed protein product [Effrenium voratum]
MARETQALVSFQVLVIGSRGAGKSTLLRAALNDAADGAAYEELADGVQTRKIACQHNAFSAVVDFIEFPADERYVALLPYFGCSAAAVALVVNISDPNGYPDLCSRLAALGSPPPCGLLAVQGSLPASVASGEERKRLEPLRDVATRWGLKFLRFESLEQLGRARLLHAVCDLVLGDVPEGADAMHLLGRRVTRGKAL